MSPNGKIIANRKAQRYSHIRFVMSLCKSELKKSLRQGRDHELKTAILIFTASQHNHRARCFCPAATAFFQDRHKRRLRAPSGNPLATKKCAGPEQQITRSAATEEPPSNVAKNTFRNRGRGVRSFTTAILF